MNANNVRATESATFFESLLESAPDAMLIVDADGLVVIANGQAERMFGYRKQELVGMDVDRLLPERLRDIHRDHRRSYYKKPSVRPMGREADLIGRRKDGGEFFVEISLSPIRSEAGHLVSSVIRDVSERRRMEQELKAAKQEAERANQANTAFLAAASHDLRQPVQAISLINGALRRTVKDARTLEMVESQDHSLTAMTNLLNSLLDISRLDAGAITPSVEEFPIQRLLDRLSSEFTRQAEQKNLHFRASPSPINVRSDPDLLAEVIQNLVSNAIRYTDSGSVEISCTNERDVCRIDVTDTGIGIQEDQIDEIFEEFRQCHADTSNKEGFGLGLAIVKRLNALLGHQIAVTSTPGKGSTFSVSLPLTTATISTTLDKATVGNTRGSSLSDSARIVLIEDNRRVANAWQLLLEGEGYDVNVTDGNSIDELLSEKSLRPKLIVSDYHLGDDKTGVQVIKRIREHWQQDIPALIVTGDTSKVVDDARQLDNTLLMNKPVNTESLLLAVTNSTQTGRVPEH